MNGTCPSEPCAPASIQRARKRTSSGSRSRRLGNGIAAEAGRSRTNRSIKLPSASNGTTNPLGPAITTLSRS